MREISRHSEKRDGQTERALLLHGEALETRLGGDAHGAVGGGEVEGELHFTMSTSALSGKGC